MNGSVMVRAVALAVILLDTVLLALTEVAWLSVRIGTVPFPVSALVAAVTTPLLVRAADRLRPGTRIALVPLVVWLLVVVVTGLWSPAGPGMFPQDWRGLLLVAAGLLPGTWVASRPVGRVRATSSS
ncbi:hypothetical protein LQ327_13050 [Actinomycetospora endophytica]|uniref:Integral membrane protein n=1 Tax=Actinomycetospora endophytica TaxID=2291215 RepID=A0ABS8P8Q3_9PSEU|nr:hypothetical protein [Actinomycetospora endophytica]MCD2194302.1 hypothetical protein [Actinomycetospora endophytica]